MQLSKLCLATKKFLSAMVITTTVLSTTPIQTINFKKSETNVSAATKKEVQSPRIIEDNYSDSTQDRKSTRLNSSHNNQSRMPSSA